MNMIEYKGYNIVESEENGRFFVVCKGEGRFSGAGYATLNNAKGIITKHLKEQEAAYQEEAARRYADVCQEEIKAVAVTQLPINHGQAILDTLAHIKQSTKPVTQSRNKREGKFNGFINHRNQRTPDVFRGKVECVTSFSVMAKTRKQFKAELLEHRQVSKEFDIIPMTMHQWKL